MSTLTQASRREELLSRLAEQAEALRSSEGWQRWLKFASRFRTYSVPNQLLIAAQYPTATQVAGYRTWLSMGRHVIRGQQGIAILAPMSRRVVNDETEEVKRILAGFKIVHVFDVSQTEGEELPQIGMPPVQVPDLDLRDQLVKTLEWAGLSVVLAPDGPEGTRGWYQHALREVTIVTSYPVASQVRTLLHELVHALDPKIGQPDSVRAERELVAESVAYLVGTELGIGLHDASTMYVTSWGADQNVLARLASQVMPLTTAASALIAAGLPKVD